jgi:signal transduction histidine kinase
MKLLAKTSLYYLIFSIPILILSGFICFYVITKEVKESNDELLFNRKIQVEQYLRKNDSVSLLLLTKSNEAQIDKLLHHKFKSDTKAIFSDTLILDKKENELADNRMITSIVKAGNSYYRIKIWRSTLEFEELIEGIFYLLTTILFFLVLTSILINLWISKTLWRPFYDSISNLKKFRASDNKVPGFDKTSTNEFSVLNDSLQQMMGKMIADYNSQKRFTENASHEIQTPLAVIKTKIDLLIQSENLKESEMQLIGSIDDACSKLIRLNKSLLLLTKIENRQFKTDEKVSAQTMVEQSLVLFEEHINTDNIRVIKNAEEDFLISMNIDLCFILISNLIQNAIRHNYNNGIITIFIGKDSLCIENTGKNEALNSELLFKRFQKDSASSLSLGLGLAIANEIAETSGLSLSYQFLNQNHIFTLAIN